MPPSGADAQISMHSDLNTVHINMNVWKIFGKMVHLPGAQLLKSCTWQPKHAHRVQGTPLISNTVYV